MNSQPTVLVVDDDNVSLSLLSTLVEQLGYAVVKARDGQMAQGALKSQPIQLVVADYDMPGLNGLELLKVVKSEFAKTPFILVTAYSNVKVIKEAWENGAFDFFQKPVFVDRLNQTIRLAIEYGHLSIARRKFPKLEEQQPDPGLLNLGVVRELAVAINRDELLNIVEEFETHARIELEQIFRFNHAGNSASAKSVAHRLAGTSVNLGLVKMGDELRAIEASPSVRIERTAELEQLLEQSIFWLRNSLSQIFQSVAV